MPDDHAAGRLSDDCRALLTHPSALICVDLRLQLFNHRLQQRTHLIRPVDARSSSG